MKSLHNRKQQWGQFAGFFKISFSIYDFFYFQIVSAGEKHMITVIFQCKYFSFNIFCQLPAAEWIKTGPLIFGPHVLKRAQRDVESSLPSMQGEGFWGRNVMWNCFDIRKAWFTSDTDLRNRPMWVICHTFCIYSQAGLGMGGACGGGWASLKYFHNSPDLVVWHILL